MFPNSVMQDLTVRKFATENNYFKTLEVNNAFIISYGSRYKVTKFRIQIL
jgi:hypothetical protein